MKNWLNIPLLDLILIKKGRKPQKLSNKLFEGSLPYLDVAAIEKNQITQYTNSDSFDVAEPNDIFVLRTGGRNGLILKGKNGIIGSTLFCLRPIIIESKYLYYYLKFKEFDYSDTRDLRTTFWKMKIPLPSISEQKQIVSVLDSTFEKLVHLHEQLEKIPRLLERYRQSVLEQAISGELTEDWREKNNIDFNWSEHLLKEIASIVDPQPNHRTPPKQENGIPYIGMGDIKNGKIDFDNARKVNMNVLNEQKKRFHLREGDIIFGKIGTIGRPALVNENTTFSLSANTILIQTNKALCSSAFLFYYLDSFSVKEYLLQSSSSSPRPFLSIQKARSIKVILPSLPEQTEIVIRVEMLLKRANEVGIKYHEAMRFINKLQQSISVKAFSGAFSVEHTDDEPLSILLEQIKIEKIKMEKEHKALQREHAIIKKNMAKQIQVIKSIVDLLKEAPNQTMTVEEVWRETVYYHSKEVELFYEELIELKKQGKITYEFNDASKTYTNLILLQNAN